MIARLQLQRHLTIFRVLEIRHNISWLHGAIVENKRVDNADQSYVILIGYTVI